MSNQTLITGFRVSETIHKNQRSLVYRAVRIADNKRVVLKTINKVYPNPEEIAVLTNEYNTIKRLDIAGVIRVYEKIDSNNTPVIVQEDIDGTSLAEQLKSSQFSITEFLDIAIKITAAIEGVHKERLMHKDINPSNIIYNRSSGELRIIDFGLSSLLNFERSTTVHPNKLEGTLEYISPEQTGRMNRSTDYRTDFYSLGISFFQILTGRLPFSSDDSLEMIHFHLAKSMPGHEDFKSIPTQLYNIVLKLTAKDAEERYQSALSLRKDLEDCKQQYHAKGNIDEFELGRHEKSATFHIPEKLYGREKELKILLDSFNKVERGNSDLLLIKGFSGIGKTALINEIQKPIIGKKGYFISGKFDQFRSVPYEGFVEAFAELANYLLSESTKQLATIKSDLLEHLGPNATILTELVREFRIILGKQEKLQELNPSESKNRFLFTFRVIIKVFASKEHPLIIFLDDIQWADESSLGLIKDISLSGIEHVLLIGAYRDNELHAAHPLSVCVSEIEKQQIIKHIELVGLEPSDISNMISDASQVDVASCSELANIVYQRTGGNPFFVRELLKSFHERSFYQLNEEKNIWQWNIAQIEKQELSDNVADYILSKIDQLPNACIEMLENAACIGGSFKLKTLGLVADKSAQETLKDLWPAVEKNMILPLSDNYRLVNENEDFGVIFKFQHDRIQQVVYQRKNSEQRIKTHFHIGNLFLENYITKDEQDLNDTLRHVNISKELITDSNRRIHIAELNLEAGRRALKAIAYQAAFEYFLAGIEMLPTDKWSSNYDLCFDLYLGYSQSAYQVQNYELAEKSINILLGHAKTKMQKVDVLRIKLRQYTTLGKTEEAIREGIAGLEILGIRLPEHPSSLTVLKEVLKAKWNLKNTRPEKLLDLPLISDEEKRAAARLLTEIGPSAYVLGNDNLYGLTQLKLVNISVKYGNMPESAFAYTAYGTVLAEAFGDLKAQHEFGELALKLNEKLDDIEFRCRVIAAYGVLAHHFNNHWNQSTSWFEEGVKAGYLSGDLFFWAYCASNCYVYDSDLNMASRIAGQIKYLKVIQQTGYRDAYQAALINLQFTRCLAGQTASADSMDGDGFSEEECLTTMQELKFKSGLGFYNCNKAILHYNNYNYEEAYHYINEAKKYAGSMVSLIQTTKMHFTDGLICSGYILEKPSVSKEKLTKKLSQVIKKIGKWADYNPVNFLHRLFLLEAELAAIKGNVIKAASFYRKAIEKAKENSWPEDEALANELYGKFYHRNGDINAASGYFREALFLYSKMGMEAKVSLIEKKFQTQLSNEAFSNSATKSLSSLTTNASKEVDLTSIIKASQAISEEIILEALLEKVINIIMQNAGAENATLVLKVEDEFVIQASAKGEDIVTMQNEPLEQSNKLPKLIINYVIHSNLPLLLNNASADGHYRNDVYIAKNKTKSALCFPILLFGKLYGLIYLENNVSTNAFTTDRLHVLSLLSSQMAISIQNAFLYANLESQVEQRTIELSSEKELSDKLLHNILPQQIAEELKIKGESEARLFENVSVLFTDFIHFTEIGVNLSPNELVSQLDFFFSKFDRINEKHGVEKIKTIGDAYMAAGGIPVPTDNSAKKTVLAALEMQELIEERKIKSSAEGMPSFEMRVGIHSGPVVAGIVGVRKFQYDIWGDTVNTASRMETNGTVGKVNISQATYEFIKDDPQFEFEPRGKMEVKGKGEMEMYFVKKRS